MSKYLEALNDICCNFGDYEPGTYYYDIILPKQKEIIEKGLEILNSISQNFYLSGYYLYAKNEDAVDGWVLVKRIENEEELNVWKELLENV